MVIIDAVAFKKVIPRGGFHILATIFVPFDIWFIPQNACAFLFDIGHGHKGADVEAHAVVEVRVPADGLFFQWFPANKDVVGRFAFEDQLQLFLEALGGGQAFLGSIHTARDVLLLTADPVAQVGVDQGFQQLGVELVVVDQGGEAVAQAIPDVPDEGTVLEQFAVLGEELLPQPGLQCFACVIGAFQQLRQGVVGPGIAIGGGQQVSRRSEAEASPRTGGMQTMPSSSA